MAAVALMMVACSSEDNVLEPESAIQQPGMIPFSATVAAPESDATTRTVYEEVTSGTDAGKIKVAWKAGDAIALLNIETNLADDVTVGTINSDGSASINGNITAGTSGNVIMAYYPADVYNHSAAFFAKFAAQGGTLGFIQDNLDWREGIGSLSVSGSPSAATLDSNLDMESKIAIWKLTLQDNSATPAALNATKVAVKNGSTVLAATTTITASPTVYLALINPADPDVHSYNGLTIEATVGNDTYTYAATQSVTLTPGMYYQSTATMKRQPKVTDLSTITDDYTAGDGDVLTGKLGSNVKISIADGATVTLKDVNITNLRADCDWACINCPGDAILVLEGDNTVCTKEDADKPCKHPGIWIAEEKTLTIRGTGSLNASSNGLGAGIGGGSYIPCGNIIIDGGTIIAKGGDYSAGIGSGSDASCGNITISGGTVTAEGGDLGAGIGSGGSGYGDASCGNITISGGTVTATGGDFGAGIGSGESARCYDITISGGAVTATGGKAAAGIGSGKLAKCDDITITSGVTSVTATKGSENTSSIGAGENSLCGVVKIEDESKVTQN